jgi:tripartite-type tricarboxylate transporter receptor subunit TctC
MNRGQRRLFIKLLCGALISIGGSPLIGIGESLAQIIDYPLRPVTLVAPWPAGGAVDVLCRTLAPKLTEDLGRPVVIENRPGVGGVLGVATVAKAAPDGYTLVMGGSVSLASSVTAFRKPLYDPAKAFAPVALIGRVPFVLVVNPALPVDSVKELIALARKEPGQLSFASGGPGSPHHLYAEMLRTATGINMVHVPYKGSFPALTDLVAGHVQLMFSDIVAALPLIRSGEVRALAVSSTTRVASIPEVPTISEAAVPGFDGVGWVMVVAPAGTPTEIISRLHSEFNTVVALPEIERQMDALGIIPISSPSPAELQRFIESEITRWAKIVEDAGIARTQ